MRSSSRKKLSWKPNINILEGKTKSNTLRITRTRYDYVSRAWPPGDCVSRVTQIIPTCHEFSNHTILISRNLLNLRRLPNQTIHVTSMKTIPSLHDTSNQNHTFTTSHEYENHTIITSHEYENHIIFTSHTSMKSYHVYIWQVWMLYHIYISQVPQST